MRPTTPAPEKNTAPWVFVGIIVLLLLLASIMF